jgi:hypothetical protein
MARPLALIAALSSICPAHAASVTPARPTGTSTIVAPAMLAAALLETSSSILAFVGVILRISVAHELGSASRIPGISACLLCRGVSRKRTEMWWVVTVEKGIEISELGGDLMLVLVGLRI